MPQRPRDRNIDEFLSRVRGRFGERLKRVILFGSRARGDYTEESDYDFILVFDKVSENTREQLLDITSELILERGMVTTAFALSEEELKRYKWEPYIINAQKEGVAL